MSYKSIYDKIAELSEEIKRTRDELQSELHPLHPGSVEKKENVVWFLNRANDYLYEDLYDAVSCSQYNYNNATEVDK